MVIVERSAAQMGALAILLGTVQLSGAPVTAVPGWGLLIGLVLCYPLCKRWNLADAERFSARLVNIGKGILQGGIEGLGVRGAGRGLALTPALRVTPFM